MRIKLKSTKEFKRLLIVKGFSQRGLGRVVGVTEPYMSQIANGDRNPGPETAKRITEELGVGFDDIFFIEDACTCEQS